MTLVYIGLGANLENPIMQIQSAIKKIKLLPHSAVEKISSLYTTKAIGPAQPDFINAVISINTTLNPHELLYALQEIEQNHKRKRLIHQGPRTLDLDLLIFGNEIINSENLIVPHPRMHLRNFVLIPLQEITPNLIIPSVGLSIASLINKNNVEDFVIKLTS